MKCLKFQRVEMQDGNLRNLSCIHQTEAVARTKLWLQEGPDRFLSTGQVLNVATKEHIRKDTITFLIAFCIPEALQMNTGLYAEKMSFHHTAIKRSHDSQLHSRTKSFIHKNSCEFSSRELNAKGCGWVFVAGLGLLQQQNPDAKVPLLGSQMGHANLQKRRSASSWLLQRSKIFCFLKAVWILLPTAEVQHGKGNVSIQTSKKPILKKNYPKGKYWGFTYRCLCCSDNGWVTTRATQKHDEVRKEIPHLLLKQMTLVPCDLVQLSFPPVLPLCLHPVVSNTNSNRNMKEVGNSSSSLPTKPKTLLRWLFQSPAAW